jgi:hypothetical protein
MMARRPIPQTPRASLPTTNMIRDDQIRSLGAKAVSAGAIVALVVYETKDGRIVVEAHDEAKSTAKGLLLNACEKAGLFE